MSRRFTATVSSVVAGAALALCSVPGAAGAATSRLSSDTFPSLPSRTHVSITLASYMPLLGPPGVKELSSLVSGFEALHPNIDVTTEAETTSSAIDGQIQQDEVAGKTPDVVQDTFSDLKFVTKSLGAVDLDQVVGKASVAALFGGPSPYATAVTKLGVVNGDVYGIPWTLSTPTLFYNATLFSQAGLNPSDPPTTWQELQTDALKIKSSTGAAGLSNGCLGAGATGADWCLQAIIDSAGGSVLNAPQTKLTFDAPKTVVALQKMQGLAQSGAMVNLSSAQTTQAFAAGKLAMVLNSSALQSSLIAADGGHFKMMAAAMPGFGTQKAVPTNSGSALFMLSTQKANREADWELMQYLTSPASETTITENIGYPPLRPAIATQAKYLLSWAKANPFLTPNLYQLEHISPWLAYPGPNYTQIETILLNAAANIAYQGASPTSTMKAAQSQATGLLS
jgi:multiple sugar transport system substrate-binding protein